MDSQNITFMNDAADFLLKNKRPASRGEQEAVTDALLCTQAVRSNLYSNQELTAQLRGAAIKTKNYSPAASTFMEEMAAEYERLTQLERNTNNVTTSN